MTVQEISYSVSIGGVDATNLVLAISISAGMEQGNSTCTIRCLSRPAGAVGDEVIVYASNGGPAQLLFRGELTDTEWSFSTGTEITIVAVGILARLRKKWGGPDRIYSDQDEAAVIRNLIEAWGLPSSRHHIESTGWTLGVIQEVVAKKGDRFIDLIAAIDKIRGYQTFDELNGAIYSLRFGGSPAGSTVATFTQGEDGTQIRRWRKPDGIVNQWTVKGLTYQGVELEATASAENATLDAQVPPELRPFYVGETLQSDLLETPTKLQEVGSRLVGDTNKQPQGVEITVLGRGEILLGDTVGINYSEIETGGEARVIVVAVQHELTPASWLTTYRTDGGTMAVAGA